jgi:hypothetical protein
MSTLDPKKRDYVLTRHERIREKILLGVCVGVCLLFFVKIVLL